MPAQIDHLVIAARTLDEGVAWCEATLGVTPGPGGAHPLMGTHNRLISIATTAFPQAYLEVIAIDPAKQPTRAAGLHRWFDLDDAALQAELAQHGPRLIHFVARVPDAAAALHALAAGPTPIDRGPLVEASRDTAAGRLDWKISVRDDGQRLLYGALPTVIEWGAVHPTDTMPSSGVALSALHASHPRPAVLQDALAALGLASMEVRAGPPNLVALLQTPRGPVTLESKGI
ncbi:VOC family protein [Variovorax arabinosiphilus]|uniref:VOC family protein n=1 Tax=Variovorax arabinosiphilus TaxID=3053498 RepID=UPI0025758B1F|nr:MULTISPECIES: VOC family protein [unclassified Variovorax]MDM0122255.1 VOC family protein [Variovorax sp. J2L1-78]MDM0131216.1 VOC family protein [Variovorax sp. J2L1-63]MDM0235018.1 VOC family protein [Variovorax sp. J2R1-6]